MAGETNALEREAQAALADVTPSTALPGWAVDERRRLVPFVSLSGAGVGVAIGLFLGLGETDAAVVELLLLLGLGAGIAAGIAGGWVLYAALGRRAVADPMPRGLRWLRGVFAVLTYFGAALAATFACAILGGAGVQALESLGTVLTVIAVFGIVFVPMSLIFGRARADATIRAQDLGGMIRETMQAASRPRT